jgi:CheY-like chemotaxis protein
VETVRDGGKLLEAVLRLDPDVVVLDVAIPVLSKWRVLEDDCRY